MRSVILLVFFFTFFAKSPKAQTILNKPKQVTITGQVDHHSDDHILTIVINRLGFSSEEILAKIDSKGHFVAVFESYVPTDVWLTYKSNFLILTHPGDSIQIAFDGRPDDRVDVLKTVKVMGSRAKTNQYAINFQQRYYSHHIYTGSERENSAIKAYEPQQYLVHLDSLKNELSAFYKKFVLEASPDPESKIWARLFSGQIYYQYMAFYALDHRKANNIPFLDNWDVPKGFYQDMANSLRIDSSMLVSSFALSSLTGNLSYFVYDNLKDNITQGAGVNSGNLIGLPEVVDSLEVYGTLQYISDPLFRQAMLTNYFRKQLEKQEINNFEKHLTLIKAELTQPFLVEPLMQLYRQTKERIDDPKVYTKAVLKELEGSSVKGIMNDILQSNKGRIIYIDVWATWCGPCLSEMPNSKLVEQEFNGMDVSFVYLCVDSKKPQWEATVSKYELAGQHYYLTADQSAEFNKSFEIKGIPFYILIDDKGNIIEKGSQLRPLAAKEKIIRLLR